MTALPADFALGTELADGRYRVVGFLGAGAMGAVYEAENTLTGKRVALKCVRLSLGPNDSAADRLLQEARFAARIRHPNVVDVYDVIRGDGHLALVMERLYGEPLAAQMRGQRLSVDQALAYLLPVMRGVAAAHRKGVIHRDIKPENIFLAHEEDALAPVPKLLDFGIAKLGLRELEQSQLTRSGQIVGTPLYMALEQFTGERDLDGRTDVYALGVVLYEALTGRTPFAAPTLPTLIYKITQTEPDPPHACCADIPLALSAMIMRTLARDRSERPASVDALIQELEPFAARKLSLVRPHEEAAPSRPGGPSEARISSVRGATVAKRAPLVLGISLAAIASVGAGVLALFGSSSQPRGRTPADQRASLLLPSTPTDYASAANARDAEVNAGDASLPEMGERPDTPGVQPTVTNIPTTTPARDERAESSRPRITRRVLAATTTHVDAAAEKEHSAASSAAVRDSQAPRPGPLVHESSEGSTPARSQLRIPIPSPDEF